MFRLKPSRDRAIFFIVVGFYGVFFLGRWAWQHWRTGISLSAGKAEYLHDEFVDVRLRARSRALDEAWRSAPPAVSVVRGGAPVSTIAGLRAAGSPRATASPSSCATGYPSWSRTSPWPASARWPSPSTS